ncbi:helix-turn-helix domain-containing protein [Gordonia sp. TBRC 11910]|uniref:Helix-turn-helix domain-containing protein n=1 Tax=Gordonia asplenii TaxID=2725283 RepID=A0A848L2W1_9ACTN|nr:helix-turn-helix domain-containing protein [Gordonia asplenii]NMO04847.1 helix-turn-helix domain-containing protein [Gordonia asplenii]
MHRWDTTTKPATDQFDYWREVICTAFVPLVSEQSHRDSGFVAQVSTKSLAHTTLAHIASQAQRTSHGPREVASTDAPYYFVNLQLRGRSHTLQRGVEATVHPGEFVVLDTSEPYFLHFDDEWQMLSFRVPHSRIDPHLHGVADPRGRAVSSAGIGRAATSLMEILWETEHSAPTVEAELEVAFAAAVAAAAASRSPDPAESPVAPLRCAILRYVCDHLGDPTLSVHSVSRVFAVSPRTLHNVFAGSDTTFAAAVRELRLEHGRTLLSAADRATSVTATALACGFTDPDSFSRAFRRHFGQSPRDVLRERAHFVG